MYVVRQDHVTSDPPRCGLLPGGDDERGGCRIGKDGFTVRSAHRDKDHDGDPKAFNRLTVNRLAANRKGLGLAFGHPQDTWQSSVRAAIAALPLFGAPGRAHLRVRRSGERYPFTARTEPRPPALNGIRSEGALPCAPHR